MRAISLVANFMCNPIENEFLLCILSPPGGGSRLLAIREHSSVMKSPQKQAFVKRLLQSPVAGEVDSWPHYFLTSIFPLLPHLPVSHFQQLTAQQVIITATLSTPNRLCCVEMRQPWLGKPYPGCFIVLNKSIKLMANETDLIMYACLIMHFIKNVINIYFEAFMNSAANSLDWNCKCLFVYE